MFLCYKVTYSPYTLPWKAGQAKIECICAIQLKNDLFGHTVFMHTKINGADFLLL